MTARSSLERIMLRSAEANGDTVTYGQPATEADIESLESQLHTSLPAEFRQIYLEFNGVGLLSDDGEMTWWLVPLGDIVEFSNSVDDWLGECLPDLNGRGIFFGDWYNGDAFGYIKDENGTLLDATIHQWDHESEECTDTEVSLLDFLDALAELAES